MFDPISQVADALRKHAKKIAADLQSRLPKLEERERYLKTQKTDVKAELAAIEVSRNLTSRAPERLRDYLSFVGANFECPRCWIYDENRVRMEGVASGDKSDMLRCPGCQTNIVIRPNWSAFMATDFIPKIGPENYAIILGGILGNDLPKAFKEWERMVMQKKDNFLLQWGIDGSVTHVEINPGEFIEYCRVTKPHSALQAIFRFATKKGLGERN